MDYSIRIGGQAGQGLQTIGTVLSKLFARLGYHVFSHQDFMSRIRGGHNFTQIRFADHRIGSSRPQVDILIALDRNTIDLHRRDLTAGGTAIYDSETLKERIEGAELLDVPFRRIAMETAGSRLMENTVAVGAVLGMLGMDVGPLAGLLSDTFLPKGQDVVDKNIAAARAGHLHAAKNCPRCSFEVPSVKVPQPLMLIDGSAGIGMGALMSGCRLYSAYPMTPSTGLLSFMAEKSRGHSLVVEQAEDEICALQMALGASFAGVRSMTGTAGGGFALMVEGLSLAGMTETPVVIYVGGRPAPATGLPTRTEQADLLFLIHAAHGEFPRVIMAPGNPEQAFYLTNKAFDLAEKYQIPAFVYGDQHLADSEWTLPGLDTTRLLYHDYRLRAAGLEGMAAYRRHAYSDTGVSPLAEPGASRHLVVTDSDEHDEEGHIIEDAETRVRMVDKRLLRKMPLIREEISPPLLYGSDNPEIILAGFGSTLGVLQEAVDELSARRDIALMHFSEIWPFPDPERHDFLARLKNARQTICIENNATSQLARLVRAETGFEFNDRLNKFDGRPFLLDTLVADLERAIG